MLSIGEFSNICQVSAKTLRYYAEIGLIFPSQINPENGYRYYSMEQLETMLFINRLKSYHFSLEEIKEIIKSEEVKDEKLYFRLLQKKKEIEKRAEEFQKILKQMEKDISVLTQGESIMSYLQNIDVQLAKVPDKHLLSVRRKVHKQEFAEEYGKCFHRISDIIGAEKLTPDAPPMVLFHSEEFSPFGMDTEFAIPVRETTALTREFSPGLCIKTILYGSYTGLPSVYAKQREWAEQEGYEIRDALFEVYVTDPSQVSNEAELITEIYCPVRKEKRYE